VPDVIESKEELLHLARDGALQGHTYRDLVIDRFALHGSDFGSATFERGGYYGGHRDTARLSVNLLLRDTLLLEPNYTRNVVTAPGRPRYVTNTLNTRVSYSFSPNLFVKGFVQYNDDRRLANLNLLLWYVYRPGSDLYIVYNHGWDTDLPGPHRVQTRSRAFTVKLTYWLSR